MAIVDLGDMRGPHLSRICTRFERQLLWVCHACPVLCKIPFEAALRYSAPASGEVQCIDTFV